MAHGTSRNSSHVCIVVVEMLLSVVVGVVGHHGRCRRVLDSRDLAGGKRALKLGRSRNDVRALGRNDASVAVAGLGDIFEIEGVSA